MKVLVAHVPAAAGHQRAAEAVVAAFHQRDVKNEVTLLNAVEKVDACYRWSFTEGYIGLIHRAPFLWGFLYYLTDLGCFQSAVQLLHRLSNHWHGKLLEDFLLESRPDLFIGTHFFPTEVAGAVKVKHHLSMRVIAVITDYLPHTLWLAPGVDAYVVGSPLTKEALLHRGIPESRIHVLGIPIDPEFNHATPRGSLATHLGIDPNRFTVLIGSGGVGTGPIVPLVKALTQISEPIQLLVVAGRNSSLFEQLENMRHKISHPMKVYGFVHNMDELMQVSDLMISKPGGLTCAETMAKGLPVIVVSPIPGQESRNGRFLQRMGVVVLARRVAEVPHVVREFMAHPERLEERRRKARENSFPEAAVHIADYGLQGTTPL